MPGMLKRAVQSRPPSGRTAGVAVSDEGLERRFSSWKQVVRQTLGAPRVRRTFALGSALFSAAQPVIDHPSSLNAVRALFAVGKALLEDVDVYSGDFFDGNEWALPYSTGFTPVLMSVLQSLPHEQIRTTENTVIRVADMGDGVKAGWEYNTQLKEVQYVHFTATRLEEAKRLLKAMLWKRYHDKSIVMRRNRVLSLGEICSRVTFGVDDAFETKVSSLAVKYADYLRGPLSAGISRSLILYGPPGTGKSTLARTIIESIGLRSFRINVGDLEGIDNATLFETLDMFEPDAIILDDFDRCRSQTDLLETLEMFKEKVKLVIVTVNNRHNLDEALMRPGRIDELVKVDRMDEDVIRTMLGDFVDGFDVVKDWPIAFVIEYVRRRTFMTPEDAARSVEELTSRIDELKRYRQDDDGGLELMLRQRRRGKGKRPKHRQGEPPFEPNND